MKKIIIICVLLALAGCQFTVGQAILTSVGSTNNMGKVESHLNLEQKTSPSPISKG